METASRWLGAWRRLQLIDRGRHWRCRGSFSSIALSFIMINMSLFQKSEKFLRAKCWLLDHRKGEPRWPPRSPRCGLSRTCCGMPRWTGHCRFCAASPARRRTRVPAGVPDCRQSTGAMGSLCAACWAQVRFIERPFCERLGTPFAMDMAAKDFFRPRWSPILRSLPAPGRLPISRMGRCGNWCIG